MTKRVNETTAGKSVSAWVILDRKGVQIGRVQAYFANSGGVTVDVLLWGDDVTKRTAEAMGYAFGDDDKITTYNGKPTRHAGEYAYKVAGVQSGRAGGYGYDKFTAALSGLFICEHQMSNHCGARMKRPKGRLWQDSDKARLAKKGYRLSNWSQGMEPGELDRYGRPRELNRYGREGVPDTASGYVDAYRMEGFAYVETQGFRFLKAI